MPQTLLKAMEIMQADNTPEVDAVVALVEHDPAVVARVLKMSNSAFYARRAEITSVRRAVVVLGPATVIGLVMSMGLAEMQNAFDDQTMAPFLDIVRHSVATAYLAKALAIDGDDGRSKGEASAEAYTAGLLHDFGKLVILYNRSAEAKSIYQPSLSNDLVLQEEERLLGTNHISIGVAVAEKLRLPEVLTEVIRDHHTDFKKDSSPVVAVVKLANQLAHALGFPESGGDNTGRSSSVDAVLLDSWRQSVDELEQYVDGIL